MPWYYVTATRLYVGAVKAEDEDEAYQKVMGGDIILDANDGLGDEQVEPLVGSDGYCHYCSTPDGHDSWCPAYYIEEAANA